MKTLLKKIGIQEKPTAIIPLSGGANNRVYRIDFDKRKPLVYKHYFQHPDDQRKRLYAEYKFLTYAWNLGLRQIPQPLACDEEKNQALYSFVPGNSVMKATEEMIDQAIHFFLDLNKHKKSAKRLPFASENCLLIEDYFATVERKLAQCRSISPDSPLHRDVKFFIEKALIPRWKNLQKGLLLDLNQSVATEDLCITPSDFGFHNALATTKQIYFLDFEYAGWDDPTKTVCDFFCQPKVPISMKYFEKVATAIASTTQKPEVYLNRIKAMLPICQFKWCCIILNAFQKIGGERRRFSDPDLLERLEKQFTLAKHYLERISYGLY